MRRHSPLLLILVLIGSLAVSQAASAASSAAPFVPTTPLLQSAAAEPEEEFEGEFEGEFEAAEEIEFEACEASAEEFEFEEPEEAEEEEFEEEAEECEEAAKKGKGSTFVTAPAECLVHRAESTITTLPGSDRVRLTIHYTNYSPAAVAIGLRLKDQKGSLELERTTKHLGRGGVLHLTTKLGEAEMERALKAREFDVELRAADTPGYCSDMLEQHLLTKHSAAKAKAASASRVRSAKHKA
jgi:hypothetical protein